MRNEDHSDTRHTSEEEETFADEPFDFKRARQGAVVPPTPGTTRGTIEIDTELLAWIDTQLTEQGGGTLSTFIHEALIKGKASVSPPAFAVVLQSDATGVHAYVPDLPECQANAPTPEEATQRISSAVVQHLGQLYTAGKTIPSPVSAVTVTSVPIPTFA